MTAILSKGASLRLLAAAILGALVLAPAALAAPPDVVTHRPIDRTTTIGVCGFPVQVHSEGVLGGPVFTEYFADGSITQVVAGRERLFIARGEGPVAMQVGRVVFQVDPAGTETVPFATPQWDLDINPELCAYLA
jgi:hypothetical protein